MARLAKSTPDSGAQEHTRLRNQYREEAEHLWNLYSSFRQSRYCEARLRGYSPEGALDYARRMVRGRR